MSKIVLLTNPIAEAPTAALRRIADVVIAADTHADTLVAAARDADAIVVRAPLPERLFDTAARLRGVVRHGAGLDMIPVDAASAHGVAVANVPAVNARSVAEFALGQMLALARSTPAMDRGLHAGGWAVERALADHGTELAGKTLVVVGLGAIGRALAELCERGLGMRVVGVRRSGSSGESDIELQSLDDALPIADYVLLACPLTDETRGLIDARRLASMKRSARLVNVARGAIVDEAALIDALERGTIAGAALDVYTRQPLAVDSRLRASPRALLTPHVAGLTVESMERMGEVAVEQVEQILAGRLPTHWVNRDAERDIVARWERLARPA